MCSMDYVNVDNLEWTFEAISATWNLSMANISKNYITYKAQYNERKSLFLLLYTDGGLFTVICGHVSS